MSEDSKGEHEIHMADHPGYDLDNHDTFFKQYGSYLLTMMYMVKYGAIAAGRVVPQLSDLRLASRIDDLNQDRVAFIDYQVDDMIAYLEQTLSVNNGATNHSLQWKLDPLEFSQLKSCLKVKEGTSASGNLRPTITQNRHSVWVCSEHQREYHRSTLQQLNEFINTNDGRYSEEQGRIKVRIRSAALTRRFLDAMRKVRWIRDFNNQWSLTALDLKLGCRCSATMSAARILINLDIVESLAVDFGRFVLSAGIPQDGIRYMEIEMGQLGELTSDDLASIPQCHFKQLTIKYTPQKADEERLITILEHSAKLEVLRIGCLAERVHAIINLVVSTREKALENDASPPLHTLEVMDEGLVPFDVERPNDTRDHVESTLTFSLDSKAFEMKTSLKLRKGKGISEEDPMCGFFREYGWSFETLDAPSSFSNSLAACLHEGTRERGSRITFLSITPTFLITSGLEALHEVVTISPCSRCLKLPLNHLEQTYQLDKALLLLGRYKDRLNNLGLYGNSIARWLPQIMRAFPTRESFPKLTVLVKLSSTPRRITPLERFTLTDVALGAEDWACVIEVMDLGALEKLNLKDTNFSHRELELLIHRLVDHKDAATMPLRTLCLDKHLFENDAARGLRATLREKASQIKIK
ncbi:hypothetical protein BGX34_007396 [Mortierella sp. NVP85]|nr:hypothetical protein BGX34_007396 [Mortierella sp. NVP85]